MRKYRNFCTIIFAGLALFVLIIDAEIALIGAREGIHLCINTVIPSLFPFFIITSLINSALTGKRINALQGICKVCAIPSGAESILLLGLLGGYPVGAQCIYEAYSNRSISKQDAHRLLGFCSNSGPAFIFGMAGALFSNPAVAWMLWGIHILTALLVGSILPGKPMSACTLPTRPPCTLQKAIEKSLRTMASVCGWVVIFRILVSFAQLWFYRLIPSEIASALTGLLELSNGCVALWQVEAEGLRFVLCAGMLGFGGMCVAMQTVSVTEDLGTGMYFPGKMLHCALSVLLAAILQQLIFHNDGKWYMLLNLIAIVMAVIVCLVLYCRKKQ